MLTALLVLLLNPHGDPSALTVTFGDPATTASVSRAEFAKLPRQRLKVGEGDSGVEYEGVALTDVLKQAKVPLGEELRGRSVAGMVLLAEAADGQKAVFGLAEVVPSFSDRMILVADRRNGSALSADEGPLRLIIPTDKRHARWLRQVKAFTIKRI